MKRFTETDKWGDPWFRKLPAAHKLVFIFLIENCNNAGFYEFDLDHVAYLTGMKTEHVEGAMKGLTRAFRQVEHWVWIKNFLRHQKNDVLNPDNAAHRQIIGLLRGQQERFKGVEDFVVFMANAMSPLSQSSPVETAPSKGLQSPSGTGQVKVKVTERRKGSAEGKPENREVVYAYAEEIGMLKTDAEGWFDHFESNGWRVGGKTPMKDWKAGLRNGHRMGKGRSSNGRTPAPRGLPIPAADLPPIIAF